MKKEVEQPDVTAHGAEAQEEFTGAQTKGSIKAESYLNQKKEDTCENMCGGFNDFDNESGFENNLSEICDNEELSQELSDEINQTAVTADENSAGTEGGSKSEKSDTATLIGTKFKDTRALLDAYDKLQSEFTKKCQTLAELKKEQSVKENEELLQKDELLEFFKENPRAVPYADKIIKKAGTKEPLAEANPLKLAFLQVAAENLKSPDELIKDEQFIKEYVLTSDSIKQKIIGEYFEGINFEKAPALIASHAGSGSPISPCNKPKSLHEAGVAARILLGNE